jgi:hypothetical protein
VNRLETLLGSLRRCCETFPDPRRGGNTTYRIADIGMAAFSVFFIPPYSSPRKVITNRVMSSSGSGVSCISEGLFRHWSEPEGRVRRQFDRRMRQEFSSSHGASLP